MEDTNFAWRLENLKGAFEFGNRALQAVLLLNGGAAISLLALIGNVAGHPVIRMSIPMLRLSLAAFALGALLAASD